jgi:hypothetical protein
MHLLHSKKEKEASWKAIYDQMSKNNAFADAIN